MIFLNTNIHNLILLTADAIGNCDHKLTCLKKRTSFITPGSVPGTGLFKKLDYSFPREMGQELTFSNKFATVTSAMLIRDWPIRNNLIISISLKLGTQVVIS